MGDPVPSSAISDATTGGLSVIVITGGSTGQVLTLQANGTYAPATVSAGIGGSVGSTDNRLVRSDGTGGSTVQSTGITVDDSNNVSGMGTLGCGTITTTDDVVITGAKRLFLSNGSTTGNYLLAGNTVVFSANTVAQGGWNSTGMYARRLFVDYANADICLARASTSVLGVYAGDGTTPAGLTLATVTASGLMCCGVYTFATVPSASSNTGKFLRISDRAQKHAYSDGTNWRFFGDDAVIS